RREQRDSSGGAKRQRDRQNRQRAADDQRPRAIRRSFPRGERKDFHAQGLRLHLAVDRPAGLASVEMRGIRFGIFGVALTGVVHNGSTNDSSSVLSRFRARNSLFFTVPRGSFFIEAISSYDSSAKWRSWINSR